MTGDATGVDASVTLGTLVEYWAAMGVKASVTPPPVDPPVDPPPVEPPAQPVDLTPVLDQLTAIHADITELNNRINQIFR